MELAEYSLSQRIRLKLLSVQEAHKLLTDVISGLAYLHQEANTVHRDLKPPNILWFGNCWKISDFGSTRTLESHGSVRTRRVSMTPMYAPPDAWEGVTSAGWDIWSLGVLTVEAMTGELPFNGESELALIRAITENEPEVPSTINGSLRWFVYHCLQKYREARKEALRLFECPGHVDLQDPSDGRQYFYAENIAFNGDGTLLASRGAGRDISLWHVPEGVLTPNPIRDFGDSPVFSPDAALLAGGTDIGAIKLWQLSDCKVIGTISAEAGPIAFSQDGSLIATGDVEGEMKLWHVKDGSFVQALRGHRGEVSSIVFSPDGCLIASAGLDTMIRIWQVSNGELIGVIQAHKKFITSVVFSPDGKFVASGSHDKRAYLWQVKHSQKVKSFKHPDFVSSLAFSPNGKLLASGCWGSKIRIWSVLDGVELKILMGHNDMVQGVAISADGKMLASRSIDGAVKLWWLDTLGLSFI